MAVQRPTFHEAWYRVADLKPRLLQSIKVHRQHFRGQMWHVLENPSSNKFSRLSNEAYQFIALLDGRRTVAQAWQICNEKLGDSAPTQPEIIQLLGQLFVANLLHGQLPPDAESLFNRYHQRITRQVQSYFMNLLFIRIPLFDPDHFLDRWVGVFGQLFTKLGLICWLILMATGLSFVINNFGEFSNQTANILAPKNLFLLTLSFFIIKLIHEFSHSFACKKFGRLNGDGGQVHVMGVMFLVFFPLPYMDATSAWAFRKKWHRVIVGAAGMIAELMIAAIAAIVWANTSPGTIHTIAHNIIFIASISTLIFNGNPLLRFDGYYIFSDLLEIPNLSQRSKNYLYYLVKRFCWGLKRAFDPATTRGERIWFFFFGIASTAYRIFICIRILLFLSDRLPEQLFLLVPVFIFASIIMWVFIPLGKFLRFLATNMELARNRLRAVTSTLATVLLLLMVLAVLPISDHVKVEGIVEPVNLAIIHAATDGFVTDFLPSGSKVSPEGKPIIKSVNPTLQAERKGLLAVRLDLEARLSIAQTREPAEVHIINEQIIALNEKIKRVHRELSLLNLLPTLAGTWISPDIEITKGMYLSRGQRIGFIANFDEVLIRTTAGQDVAMLIEQAFKNVDIRIKARPDLQLTGSIKKILPAGQQILPSAALGYAGGGSIPTLAQDKKGTRTAERFFEIQIAPNSNSTVRLLSGQRVITRFQMPPKPLALQWWRSLRQLFQRRFHI